MLRTAAVEKRPTLVEPSTPGVEDLVFASRAKTIRHPNNVHSSITDARTRVGLVDLPMNPHTYRKTVGTKIGQKDPEKAASQLGHSTSEVTKRFYIQPRPRRRRYSRLLGRLRGP
ncbi:hypothetical protein [Nocardia australiensis]|uniref:hypothetical protein n=1 Tax=Nocardia australiensis TaxID=2887191 RepID=UPI001D15072A|nr:hypothetical protein [Nocardia australiensis]